MLVLFCIPHTIYTGDHWLNSCNAFGGVCLWHDSHTLRLQSIAGGGPAIPRKVVSESSGVRVDVYPFILKIFKYQEQDKAKTLQIPKQVWH